MTVKELRNIAKQYKIKITKNGKYKTMKELKNEINIYNKTGKGINQNEKIKSRETINKLSLLKQIYNYTKENALNDYNKLPKNCNDLSKLKPMSNIGTIFIGYFTNLQRLNTQSRSGLNFWDFYKNRHNIKNKSYVKKMFEYYKNNNGMTDIKVWWRLFNLYCGSINIFKPTIAMFVYCKYKPKSILDPTMGWGGRLVGATSLNIFKYTGIDLNPELKKPYTEMVKTLKPLTKTKIKLIFKNALKVDYSKIEYDLVLTSPPYYNIEIYNGTAPMNKEEWNNKFYKPLFTKTYTHLKKGGHYCLNVPEEIYNNVCIDLFGKATEFLPLPKASRTKNDTYKEYIYVWKK